MMKYLVEVAVGVLLTLLIGVSLVIVAQQYQAATVQGSHTEAIAEVRNRIDELARRGEMQSLDIKRAIADSESKVIAQLVAVDKRLAEREIDVADVLRKTGIAKDQDVFQAAIIDNNVWIFPDATTEARFIKNATGPSSPMARYPASS